MDFMIFHTRLYKSETHPSSEKTSYEYVCISQNCPNQTKQMQKVTSFTSQSKSPGLDRFPVEYHKKNESIYYYILYVLTDVNTESSTLGTLLDTFNDALLTLMWNRDKEPSELSRVRPATLIDVDNQILTKELATRMESILPHVTPADQVGFVKGCSLSDNIKHLLHIIWSSCNEDKPIAAFWSITKQTFDRLE